MRIRKRWPAASLAPSTRPLESLHHHQPPTDPPIKEAPPPPPRSDIQLTLVKGSNGWICKTDDDCMQSNSSTQSVDTIGEMCTAAKVHTKYRVNSSGAKGSEGISSSASASLLEVESNNSVTRKRKKIDNDSALSDDSRCSRVNGSGWRCWKQAVVGYSLCAHHFSQGRFRSTISFKGEKQRHTALSSLPLLLDDEPLIMLMKRRKKIGIVKNRSISSLLEQTESRPAPSMPVLDSITIL